MRKIVFFLGIFLVFSIQCIIAQSTNVGIGTTNPAEKLDVNGNINVAGTIKTNGQDGTAGQVLMKNSSGKLSWGSLSEYKNFKQFDFTFVGATQNFTIPTGVTKIAVELWGAGGGGANGGGGGAGGYAYCVMNVFAGGTLSIVVGLGGQGATGAGTAASGGSTQATFSTSTFAVGGGVGSGPNFPGIGGNLALYSGDLDIISYCGQTGRKNQLSYQQISPTEFVVATKYGNGGSAPYQPSAGGEGGQSFVSTTTGFTINDVFGAQGMAVGEGGGGGLSNGYNGATGRVIVRW